MRLGMRNASERYDLASPKNREPRYPQLDNTLDNNLA
jgi:hypothetical protein